MIPMSKKIKRTAYEIGIITSLIGIPISSVINEYLHGVFEVTNIILFLSLLLVIDYKRLLRFKIRINLGVFIILFYQVYVIIIQLIAGQSLFEPAQGMIYTIYMIFVVFAVCSREKIEEPDHFIKTAWILLGGFNVALMLLFTNFFTSLSIKSNTVLPYGADRVTLSKLAFTFLITHLAYSKSKNRKNPIVTFIFLVSTIFNILCCHRRATLVYFFIICILHFFYYNNGLDHLNRIHFSKRVLISIGIAVLGLVALIRFVPNLQRTVSEYMGLIANAFNTLFGNNQTDVSAATRNVLRMQALDKIDNSSFVQLLFGRGYMDEYIDFPLLQAYMDMGFMVIVYLFIQLIYPLRYLTSKSNNPAEIFFKYFVLLFIFDNFFAGIPYGYGKFVAILFLFVQVKPYKMGDTENI